MVPERTSLSRYLLLRGLILLCFSDGCISLPNCKECLSVVPNIGPPNTRATMATQVAIVMEGEKTAKVVHDRPIPKLRNGYLLVKVVAIALNPTDWKHIDFQNTPGSLSGCDYAGVVEEVGAGYSKEWKVGDRICGAVHGGNSMQLEDGAFAEHIVAKADLQMKLPEHMSFEEGATLGVGIGTCGMGLFQRMGLNLPTSPTNKPEPVLIYGGSSATGTLGIQFAKLYVSKLWSQTRS